MSDSYAHYIHILRHRIINYEVAMRLHIISPHIAQIRESASDRYSWVCVIRTPHRRWSEIPTGQATVQQPTVCGRIGVRTVSLRQSEGITSSTVAPTTMKPPLRTHRTLFGYFNGTNSPWVGYGMNINTVIIR